MSGNSSSSMHLGDKTAMFLKRGTPSFLPVYIAVPSDLNSVSSETTKWVMLILIETKQHNARALERNNGAGREGRVRQQGKQPRSAASVVTRAEGSSRCSFFFFLYLEITVNFRRNFEVLAFCCKYVF